MAAVSGRWNSPSFVLLLFILSGLTVVHGWDSIDLELFDLVEEIKDNFYEVLGLTQDAEQAAIRRAYRKLSLQLHPDRNKEPDAEIKFRQLVAVSEVLKDEDKRKRYDAILRDGLPDWRQPVYYYRRVRKMGLIEFLLLIFLILTIGHYIVAWSIYLEKKFELEELLFSKMKREEKKRKKEKLKSKLNDDDIPDLADMLVEEAGVSKPTFQDLLPLKLARMLVNFCRTLPQQSQELLEYWRERKREKIEEDEDEEEEEEEEKDQPIRPRRRQRVNVIQEETDDADWEGAPVTSVLTKEEDVEQPAAREKQSGEWTDHELSLLSRAMIKFPGGTPKRWDKIAVEIGRSVEEVTKQMKRMKQSYGVPVNPSNSDAGELRSLVMNKKKAVVSDECMESYDNVTTVDPQTANKPKNSKPAVKQVAVKSTDNGTVLAPGKGKDATNSKPAVKQVVGPSTDSGAVPAPGKEKQDTMDSLDSSKDRVVDTDGSAWSQNQQKQLEQALQQFPKTVADRWICIARAVPGKTKEECISRYKFLVECVRKRKLAGQQ